MYALTAIFLLLGALQPVLGSPALQRPPTDGTHNVVVSQRFTSDKVLVNYQYVKPECDGSKPWVGVWPADTTDFTVEPKDRADVKETPGNSYSTAKLAVDIAKLEPGQFVAAFVCEGSEGKDPWMRSRTIKIEAKPRAKEGQCLIRRFNGKWTYNACNMFGNCNDCQMVLTCDACHECKKQCGPASITC